MNASAEQVAFRPIPLRRRKIRAVVIPIIMYIRTLIASWCFIKPFFMSINGVPCLRERRYALPQVPFWLMVRLKWLYFRGVWKSTTVKHEPKIEARFLRVIEKIEKHVEKNYPEVTEEVPLPEYDWRHGDPEDFYEKFVKTPQPVVLRGYALQTEAVKKWSFDYIIDKCGEVEVMITEAEGDRPGKLKEVRDPSKYCANSDAPFKAFPELADDLSIPQLQPYIKRRNTWNQFFVGLKATGSGYHCAGIWNFFFMIDGQKKWTFVDPELTWMIYPNNNTGALAYASLVGFPHKADLSIYKLYKYCPRFSVTLSPGDVLMNPPWWWHTIDNLTPTSVAVATRWDAIMGDFSFYEINRTMSVLAMVNPLFPRFLHKHLLTHTGHGRHVITTGAGAFDEDEVIEIKNQKGRTTNQYQGTITQKVRAGKKW